MCGTPAAEPVIALRLSDEFRGGGPARVFFQERALFRRSKARGDRGEVSVECRRQARLRTRLNVKNTRSIFKVCCTLDDQRRRPRAPTLNY
eukprot:2136558-Pyramimonas_sp.AAC.1